MEPCLENSEEAFQPGILHSAKPPPKCEGKIKIFSDLHVLQKAIVLSCTFSEDSALKFRRQLRKYTKKEEDTESKKQVILHKRKWGDGPGVKV